MLKVAGKSAGDREDSHEAITDMVAAIREEQPVISETLAEIRSIIGNIRDLLMAPFIFLTESLLLEADAEKRAVEAQIRQATAIHECGHTIIDLLGDYKIRIVSISPFASRINSYLGIPEGLVSYNWETELEAFIGNSRLVKNIRKLLGAKSHNDTDNKDKEDIAAELLSCFAGFVAEYMYTEGGNPGEIVDDASGDIEEFWDIVYALNKGKRCTADHDLFIHILVRELTDFFSNPLIRKIINIFSKELLARRVIENDGRDISYELEALVLAKGISADELSQAQSAYRAMAARVIEEVF